MAGELLLINPRKRKARKSKSKSRVKRKSRTRAISTISTRKRTRKYRRNPIGGRGMVGGVIESVKDGAIGAAGGIVAEIAGGFLPLPAQLKTGIAKPLVDALIGIGVGYAVSQFANKNIGKQMAQGAVTLAMYRALRPMVSGKMGLAGDELLGEYNLAGDELLGEYELGDYDDANDMGAYDNAAPVDYYNE